MEGFDERQDDVGSIVFFVLNVVRCQCEAYQCNDRTGIFCTVPVQSHNFCLPHCCLQKQLFRCHFVAAVIYSYCNGMAVTGSCDKTTKKSQIARVWYCNKQSKPENHFN